MDQLIFTLTQKLCSQHLKIATAESCTGGLIASALTEISGSSIWFDRGFVTYSNLAKVEMLGLKSELIDSQGAVSKEVAEAMAAGALQQSAADISLAVTGIAGPDGGTKDKPVGTVWFAWARANKPVLSLLCQFSPDLSRQAIRQQACHQALEGAIAYLS